MLKNLDEIVRLQSEKDESGYERQKERDYKGLQRAQVALPVWPVHQLRRAPGGMSVRGPIVA